MREDALHLIDRDAVDQVLAFGLLRARERTIFQEAAGHATLEITKAHRPTANLYRLYIAGSLAATVLVRRETSNWVHATGLLVAEHYRGKRVTENVPGQSASSKGATAAALMMNCYTSDLVMNGLQVTSECINGNVRSWRLSERMGYRLLNDQELHAYAAYRNKKIKREFPVEGGKAVQWEHTADDPFNIGTWSANRVYGKKPDDAPFAFTLGGRRTVLGPLRTAATVLCFGSPFLLAAHKLRRTREEAPADTSPSMLQHHLTLGLDCLRMGKAEKAIEAFRKVIELSPGAIRARGYLADAHLQNHDVEEAIRVAEEALEMAPDFGPAHSDLASAYYTNGEYKKAIEHLDKAIALGLEPREELLRELERYR